MDGIRLTVPTEPVEERPWVERAARHALQLPLRYRVQGKEEWSSGETLNLSESGVLFSSDQVLEINDKVEITFQTTGTPMLHSSTRIAQIVRRVLANWPETRPLFGARFQ